MAQSTARPKGKRIGLWIIIGLLFVGLIGFGTTNLSGTVRTIGTAGETEIGVQDYSSALTQQIDALSAQLGQPISFPQAQAFGIDRAVLGQVVSTAVLDNEVARIGLSVGDARVAAQVLEIPAFRGLSGSFDREAYAFTLERNGLSEAEFEAGLRADMARTLLQQAVLGGVPDATAYADAVVAFIGQQRSFTWAPIGPEILTQAPSPPTQADIMAHYQDNPQAYTAPEIRRITYAGIGPEMIQAEVEVDETAVRDLYDARINDYIQPERRLVERLVFGDAPQATAALGRVAAGDVSFDDLVAERGLDLADVDMGDMARNGLGAAADGVFAARPGDVVGPFDTSVGPALFRVNAILNAAEIGFDDAAPDLRAELARDRARRVIDTEAERITDLIAGGATLEDLADQTLLTLGSLDWTEGVTDGIAAYDIFRQQAALAQPGAFPELFALDDGGVFALRVDEVVPPALRPLDEVRDQVAADAAEAALVAAQSAAAEDLARQVQAGADFASLGLVANTETGAIRRTFVAGTPAGFITRIYDMEQGEAQVLTDETGLTVLVQLNSIAPVDRTDPTMVAEAAAVAERAAQGIAQDIYGVYTGSVQSRTDVSIDQGAINAVHTGFQ